MYTYDEVYAASLTYFDGDELAAKVFVDKYALSDNDGNFLEKTPADTHRRLANEFARIEAVKYKDTGIAPMSSDEIFDLFDKFKYLVPGGRILFGLGNHNQYCTLSNCYVTDICDSYPGIMKADEDIINISRRGGGIGLDISPLRPSGSSVKNAAKNSTGAVSFMHRFSKSIREVGQCIEENQRVLTQRGLISIRDINPMTDYAWTKIGWVKIKNKINTGNKQVYQITTKAGYTVKVSKDHRIAAVDKDNREVLITAKDLKLDDKICLLLGENNIIEYPQLTKYMYEKFTNGNHSNRLNEDIILPTHINEDLAYLLGYTYGNAHVEYDKFNDPITMSISSPDKYPEIQTKIFNLISKVFGFQPKISNGCGKCKNISIHNKAILHFLLKNKVLKGSSLSQEFPEKIINTNYNIHGAFIAGYIDADGDITGQKNGYRISSINHQFLQNIQTILLNDGILSKIHTEIRKNEKWHTLYKLSIIGSYSTKKILSLLNNHSIKANNKQYISTKDNWLTPYTVKSLSIKHGKYNYCPGPDVLLSINCIDRLKKNGENISNILAIDKIISINSDIQESITYDLELELEHLFWCEGLYVHNSNRRGALILTMSVHHPEIEKFIDIKNINTDVTGANISVRLTDEFLQAVATNSEYELRYPVDSKTPNISQKISAKHVWDKICANAHKTAEPGILFWDTIIKESPADCYKEFESITCNPCCIAEDSTTMVITYSGLKEIKTITCYDLIYIESEKTWAKTSGYFESGNAEVFRVKFENGHILDITNNHKLCLSTGVFIELRYLKVGDKIATNSNFYTTISEITSLGTKKVGCISVDKYHCFTANGIISGNSEIPLSKLDSCRLLAINLYNYIDNPFTDIAKLNTEKLYEHARFAMRLMDDLIDLELEYIDRIINKINSDP